MFQAIIKAKYSGPGIPTRALAIVFSPSRTTLMTMKSLKVTIKQKLTGRGCTHTSQGRVTHRTMAMFTPQAIVHTEGWITVCMTIHTKVHV